MTKIPKGPDISVSMPRPHYEVSRRVKLYNGIGAGMSYSAAGQAGGGLVGCRTGAAFAGPYGCALGGSIGWSLGGLFGFEIGFLVGWKGSDNADAVEGTPAFTPNPFTGY